MVDTRVASIRTDVAFIERYALEDASASLLFNDFVSIASQVFENALIFIVLRDLEPVMSNQTLHGSTQDILRDLLQTIDNTTKTPFSKKLKDNHPLQVLFDELMGPGEKILCTSPIHLQGEENVGGLFIVLPQSRPATHSQIATVQLLTSDLTTKLITRNHNRDLVRHKALYELILETTHDLVFVKDQEFKLVFANKHFLDLYPPEMRDQVIGYTTLESYPKEEVDEFLQNDRIAFRDGISNVIEKITFPSGVVKTINTIKTRFYLSSGEPYILGVAHDITERQELIDRLIRSNQELDEFAYIASHDLKSPLLAIKRLVSFIEEDAGDLFDGATSAHFDLIKSRSDRMLTLLRDLLNFARIGKEKEPLETLNMSTILDNCLPLLDVPNDFSINLQHDISVRLPSTPLQLMLVNLLSNAIKHHDKPAGTINIECRKDDTNYYLDVSDDGPGIPVKLQQKIFEKFQTLKPRDVVEGSGLGLPMVKKTIELYGGIVNVKSQIGQGASFCITWPIPKE